MSENDNKTLKQKINEPILNVKQIIALLVLIIYEVVANLSMYLYGVPEAYMVVINIGVGIISLVLIALLRAAYPEEVPDKTFVGLFKMFFKQIIDVVFDTNKEHNADDKMTLLEKTCVWSVREWDVLYQEKLREQIDYYKKKIKIIEKKNEPRPTDSLVQ